MTDHRRTEDLLYCTVSIQDKQRFWKRILIVDDDVDVTITFKAAIENINNDTDKRIEVQTSKNPVVALSDHQISMTSFWLTLICHI
jgi:predicted phosphoribosyltransferase